MGNFGDACDRFFPSDHLEVGCVDCDCCGVVKNGSEDAGGEGVGVRDVEGDFLQRAEVWVACCCKMIVERNFVAMIVVVVKRDRLIPLRRWKRIIELPC